MSNRCKDLVRQARSSRIKHVYNALVAIRKNFLKSHGVNSLVEAGLVSRLVQLIRERETVDKEYQLKVVDISLSILGNMCMEQKARNQVVKDYGVPVLGDFFLETDEENLQNRSCRCLANILLSPSTWELVHGLSILEKLSKLLNDTESSECKQTYIRAVRLLGQTPKNVGRLVEKNALAAVLKHVDCENNDVSKVALRCVLSMSVHGCTLQFASQVITSKKLEHFLTLIQESNQEVFKLVSRLAEHYNFRHEFGKAGVTTTFIEYFQSNESPFKEWRIDILNILCLCCQESVNRWKLRENGALGIFVDSLSDESLKVLHERIVSSLVCFLYEEKSFDIILDKGIVTVLCKMLTEHVKRSVDRANQQCNRKQVSDKAQTYTSASVHDEVDNQTGNEIIQNDESDAKSQHLEDTDCKADGKINLSNNSTVVTAEEEMNTSASTRKSSTETDADKSSENEEKLNRPKYSINSPTYESLVHDLDDSYSKGAKCIEKFTPPHGPSTNLTDPYSPLSNSSYYSPSEGSPDHLQYSPDTSPDVNRAARDTNCDTRRNNSTSRSLSPPEHLQHKYTGVCGPIYKMACSPDSSPERVTSPPSAKSVEINKTRLTCSCNTFNSEEEMFQNCNRCSPSTSSSSPNIDPLFDCQEYQYSPVISTQDFDEIFPDKNDIEVGTKDPVKTKWINAKSENSLDKETSLSADKFASSKPAVEKQYDSEEDKARNKMNKEVDKKRKRHKKASIQFENNILILLSRVSQMKDPTMHLVTKEFMTCLFDYLIKMESPLARAARLLSRTFRNPLCFQKHLLLQIPFLISTKLLDGRDYSCLVWDLLSKKTSRSRSKQRSGHLEKDQDNSPNSDRFSLTDESTSDADQQPYKRHRSLSTVPGPHESKKVTDSCIHRTEGEDICCTYKSGIAFLEDLNVVADTPFGRGVVERLLHISSEDIQVDVCFCIPFIVWSLDTRKYYFLKLDVLDKVFSLIQDKAFQRNKPEKLLAILKSLCTLAKISNKSSRRHLVRLTSWTECHKARLASTDRHLQHSSEREAVNENCDSCKVESHNATNDTVFLVQGKKILVNRAVLTGKSDVFVAMLNGRYSEAKMSEIPLSETSKDAIEFMIHYLYGCDMGHCSVINSIVSSSVSRESAVFCIDLMSCADKYLLPKLRDYAGSILIRMYICPEWAYPVYEYSLLCENIDLQREAIWSLLIDSSSDNLAELFCDFLNSKFSEIFCQTVCEILTE